MIKQPHSRSTQKARSARLFGFASNNSLRAVASLFAVACVTSGSPVAAQTVIFDGTQSLNFFSGSHLTDDLMLTNDPNDATRNGVVNAGADPNLLEPGDAAWFRSTGRRMRSNIEAVGLAGSAVGVDGAFMTAGSETNEALDNRGHGAGYVLFDNKATTGLQDFKISMFYNDPTPNLVDGDDLTGGNVAIRIVGIQGTGIAGDPWDVDEFTYLAGSGRSGALLSSGNVRDLSGDDVGPEITRLFFADSSLAPSSPDVILTSSDEWQELTFTFDAGDGYDFLIFSVGGVTMDLVAPAIGADGFAFDNISFEPSATVVGDFNGDGLVDCADLDGYVNNIGVAATGALSALDIDGDGTLSATDANTHITTLVVTMPNGVTGTFPGDLNCDGTVNVLGDAFALVGNLGNSVTTYAQGDINFDGTVNVLGDAFALVGNLGMSND